VRRVLAFLILIGAALSVPALSSAVPDGDSGPIRPSVARPLQGDLLPDLRVRRTDIVEVERDGERRELRFSTEVANVGRGPLELVPAREDCDRNSDLGDDRTAYQSITGRHGGERHVRAGCVVHHRAHGHWHFEGFARYTLLHADDGRPAATSRKVSFCLIDSARTPAVPGSLAGEDTYSSCGADATQGISVGWYDRYGAGLPGQSIDLSGVAPGRYRLVIHADYEDRLVERDEGNNRAALLVDLRADSLGGIGRAAVVG
jgi:Lysyl oxidase